MPLTLDDFPFNKGQVVKGSILANRASMRRVLELAAEGKIRTVVDRFLMSEAHDALRRLSDGKIRSRAVLYNE